MTTYKLSNTEPMMRSILGVGDFGGDREPIAVSASIAAQYDTEEMKALGWVVAQQEGSDGGETAADTPPQPTSADH